MDNSKITHQTKNAPKRELTCSALSAEYWREARRELTNPRTLVFAALIIALRIIIKGFKIPLAAGLFGLSLSPMIGAAMMSLSSFSVVSNALRLNLWKPKKMGSNPCPCKENAVNTAEKQEKITEKEDKKMMNVTIKVDGMMCPHCEARVKKVCEAIEGVVLATPSHTDGCVKLEMERDMTDACKAAITDAGYDVLD